MYPALIFHSFNNNPNSDKFYDLKIETFTSLIDFISKEIKPTKITLTFDDGFKSIIPAVEYAMEKGFITIAYIISDYIDKDGFLSRNDIKYLNRIGCIIGSHSKSHRDLSKLAGDLLKTELIESKRELEKIIGEDVNHFSFPYGAYNKYAKRAAKTIYTFNAISKPNFFKEKNIIGRISINSLNCDRHNNILELLRKKISYKYVIRIFISKILKTFLPNKIYIFLKNAISKNKSEDIFNGK
tara:strand:+ start:7151 stop:7873 length:723 start_codon:yes stop_codon:yes gene_type:complete